MVETIRQAWGYWENMGAIRRIRSGAKAAEAVNAQELLPMYLRPAQAERLRNAKPEP